MQTLLNDGASPAFTLAGAFVRGFLSGRANVTCMKGGQRVRMGAPGVGGGPGTLWEGRNRAPDEPPGGHVGPESPTQSGTLISAALVSLQVASPEPCAGKTGKDALRFKSQHGPLLPEHSGRVGVQEETRGEIPHQRGSGREEASPQWGSRAEHARGASNDAGHQGREAEPARPRNATCTPAHVPISGGAAGPRPCLGGSPWPGTKDASFDRVLYPRVYAHTQLYACMHMSVFVCTFAYVKHMLVHTLTHRYV